ncbi:MAG: AAA family ATPase [Chloroflexi bacterium]|nr:AAA family ATPase [Chloroflexota bacterium]
MSVDSHLPANITVQTRQAVHALKEPMMLSSLEIKNFKSIKSLKLGCKRLNIFIGEPNTGKSNILESIGMFSFLYYSKLGYDLHDFVRFESTSNLFYDEILDAPLSINIGDFRMELGFKDGDFAGSCHSLNQRGDSTGNLNFNGDHSGLRIQGWPSDLEPIGMCKFYRFRLRDTFQRRETEFLLPPFGDNLMSMLLSNKDLRVLANEPFKSRGHRLGLRPQEQKIEVIKDVDDVIISHPYHLSSETFQRLIFYMAAITTNKDSVLAFEEPEAHAFPFYTKYLAEMIALDENNNQYFISTHNPYFLMPLMEKAPADDLAIFITYYEDYQTKVKPLSRSEMERITEIDVFSNIPAFLEAN